MRKSLKTLLGLSLLGFFGVWIGCSSDSAPVAPYSASKAQDTSPTTGTGIAGVDFTEVNFTDNNLKYEVALAIFPAALVPPKETFGTTVFTITRADLRGLEVLKASGKEIANLSGLEWATNLDTLVLNGNSITSLDSLARLTNLEYLDLRGNSITDVTPLARLTNLEHLNLIGNSITILTPLAGLTSLEYLALRHNSITDVSHLAGLTNLEHLNLDYNQIRDVSSLASLTNLEDLRLGINTNIGSSAMGQLVASLPDLEFLKINDTGLTDISFLESLTKVKDLNISHNPITNLKPVVCLPKLEILHVKGMPRRIGNATDGFNKHIQYLMDNDVTVIYLFQ